jgi:hypothetical protein
MEGVDAACETFFHDYLATHGRPPGRNQMVRLMAASVPERRIQTSWRVLMGRAPAPSADNHQEKEPSMETFPIHDVEPALDTQLTALAVALAQQHRDSKALASEVGELRALVEVLTPRPQNGPKVAKLL